MKKTFTLLLALGLFSATAATAQSILNNGLMAYYPFTGNTLDMSGNNRHLFNSGAVLTASQNGTPNAAYQFNGVNSYMQLSTNAGIDFTGDFTICMQVKPTGYYKGACHGNVLINKSLSGNDPYGVVVYFEDGYYTNGNNCNNPVVDTIHQTFYLSKTHLGTGYATGNVPNSPYATYNTWRSLVMMQKGDSLYQYVDGVFINRVYAAPFNATNNYDIFLGKTNNTTNIFYFNGVMDEVRIYNRALSDTEVVQYGNYDPLAVKENVLAASLSVSPNPATDVLRITNTAVSTVSFRVLDLQGRALLSGTAPSGETVLPVSQLTSGMYLVQVQQDKGAMQTLRFVKD